MKKIIYSLLLALLASACTNDTEKIKQAAQGYLDAMGNYQPTQARPFATKETGDVTLKFFEYVMKNTDPKVYANNMPAEITLGEVTIHDTTATVAFHKSTPSTQQDGTIDLVKRKGEWKVQQLIKVPPIMNPEARKKQHNFTPEEIRQLKRIDTKDIKPQK